MASPGLVDEAGYLTIEAEEDAKQKANNVQTSISVASLLGIWYSASISTTFLNKVTLIHLNSVFGFSLLLQIATVIVGYFYVTFKTSKGLQRLTRSEFMELILPLGIFWSGTTVFYNLAMAAIPVSFLNTIKSSIPLWTCLICRFWFKQEFGILTYFSLFQILAGVGFASLNEIGFNIFGLVIACCSAICNTLFNIFAKRAIQNRDKRLDYASIQIYTSICAICIIGPMWFISETDLSMEIFKSRHIEWKTGFLVIITGIFYYFDILLSYVAIARLPPLTFSVCDVVRRLAMIISSVVFFGNVISPANALGIVVAMSGVLMYNISRNDNALQGVVGTVRQLIVTVRRKFKPKREEGQKSLGV